MYIYCNHKVMYFAISFCSICDHLVDLNRRMFPDSQIASQMQMKRTKCANIVHKLGKFATEQLALKLRDNKYSIIIDETTDCSVQKSCAIIVKFFDTVKNEIKTQMLDLVNVYANNEGSTGDNIFNMLLNCLHEHGIPLNNLVGFAADGASNIMGKNNSVSSRLKSAVPGITIFKCVAHSIHLCSSEAAKTLPRACEDLLRNVHNFFSHSAKRTNELKEFQDFCAIKPNKLLHVCATRWLSLHAAVERLLQQWNAIKLYFQGRAFEERLLVVDFINEKMQDPSIYCYLRFLNYILSHISKFNLIFQSKTPTLHLIHDNISELYKFLLCTFSHEHMVSRLRLHEIDPSDELIHKPLSQLYLGSDLHAIFQRPEYLVRGNMILDIRQRCKRFLIVLCKEIRKRFELDNQLWQLAAYLHPKRVISSAVRTEMPSLRDLIACVSRISSYDRQAIDNQWRTIQWHKFPEEFKSPACNVASFYQYILAIEDNNGNLKYEMFGKFALEVLSLPLSNADAERIFSKLNLVKNKTRCRLQTHTVKSLIAISEYGSLQGGCNNFEPDEDMLHYMK